ncbi:MAG: hypothetical protein JSU90_07715 [Nitrospiraceae bacterium]|nr:MAG: hypothetical protein JSU90_07715 [Nitrospiraceae bacterium]
MGVLKLENIAAPAADRIGPFMEALVRDYGERIHSLHITGTAVTKDYDENVSDINSIIVLKKMDLKFLEVLAPLGNRYGKDMVAAPLIMTPRYIEGSLDVFPIEFLNFRLIHSTVWGADILKDLVIDRKDLRQQCERELKTKLIWLRQGYLSTRGDREQLTAGFVNAISGYIPLFRSIIVLKGMEPPVRQRDVITILSQAAGVNTDVFSRVLREKHERTGLSLEDLNTIFEDYYAATEEINDIVDTITV